MKNLKEVSMLKIEHLEEQLEKETQLNQDKNDLHEDEVERLKN